MEIKTLISWSIPSALCALAAWVRHWWKRRQPCVVLKPGKLQITWKP